MKKMSAKTRKQKFKIVRDWIKEALNQGMFYFYVGEKQYLKKIKDNKLKGIIKSASFCATPFLVSLNGSYYNLKWNFDTNRLQVFQEREGINHVEENKPISNYFGEIDYSRQPRARIIYTPMGNKR